MGIKLIRHISLIIAAITFAWIRAPLLHADGRVVGAINEAETLTRGVSREGADHAMVTCPPQWGQGFHIPSVSGVQSLAVFDDGSGPSLYLGGSFDKAWNVWARTIAKWDGNTWTAFPESFGPYNPSIDEVPVAKAMIVFDDGTGPSLFVGGCFVTAGNVVTNSIAKWNGHTWSALGGGIDDAYSCTSWGFSATVHALAVFDDGAGPALYAAGRFASVDGIPASNIAKWNGTSWSPLGAGLDGMVRALAVFDDGTGPALYAGGGFQVAGGGIANAIAKWDGSSWSALTTGIDGTVFALAAYDDGSLPALFAGGDFTTAGGSSAGHIAKWDGLSWSPVADGLMGTSGVRSMAVFEAGSGLSLYAGGYFTHAGSVETNRIARWDGATWSSVGGGIDPFPDASERINAITVFDLGGGPNLIVAGEFESAGGVYANGMAQWDGTAWSRMQGPPGAGLNGWVFDLTPGDDGTGLGLFAGGRFTQGGGEPLNRIGKWNGVSWSSLGVGMNEQVNEIAFFDDGNGPSLYAAGAFTEAGGIPANRVAKWRDGVWTTLGDGLGDNNTDTALALAAVEAGPAYGLYSGGNFLSAGGLPVSHIARWDGSTWLDVGGGVSSWVFALTSFDDGTGPQLYAGGYFLQAGAIAVNRVARWDGTSWWPVGSGLPEAPTKLVVLDDGSGPALYAAWDQGVSKWNGAQWIMIGSTHPYHVNALAYFDDGSGPGLFAAGYFFVIGGVSARHIAKWDGSTWMPLEGYINSGVYDLAVFNDGNGPGLFIGGEITRAGNTVSSGITKWYNPCPPAPIPAVSEWGVALMALATILAGVLLLRRRNI